MDRHYGMSGPLVVLKYENFDSGKFPGMPSESPTYGDIEMRHFEYYLVTWGVQDLYQSAAECWVWDSVRVGGGQEEG